MTAMTKQRELRAEFARRLSLLYGREVPAYAALLQVSQEVNAAVLAERGDTAERLGSIARVTAERHGAIRVGTPTEIAQVGRIFAAMGMHPVGFYDLRDAADKAVPVVSTAFRPIDVEELAYNPFRVFTSMLVPSDRRFFTVDLQKRLNTFLSRRELFSPELLSLADRAIADHGLQTSEAERFLKLAADAFKLSSEPVDRGWYEELERVSSVAADIGGVSSTHINHLTPRVLDIDDLYRRMDAQGIEMIDAIQGPPRWSGPDLLLRQTSFRALAEPRVFREPDGRVTEGSLRVRFGEVESRGIAATPRGRALFDQLNTEVDQRVREASSEGPVSAAQRTDIGAAIWNERVPTTERGLVDEDLAYFTFECVDNPPRRGQPPTADLRTLLRDGWVRARPIVYEDFLPKSAAGIFQSNLTSDGGKGNATTAAVSADAAWVEGILGVPLHDPHDLYAAIRTRSLAEVARHLRLPMIVADDAPAANDAVDADTAHPPANADA